MGRYTWLAIGLIFLLLVQPVVAQDEGEGGAGQAPAGDVGTGSPEAPGTSRLPRGSLEGDPPWPEAAEETLYEENYGSAPEGTVSVPDSVKIVGSAFAVVVLIFLVKKFLLTP